MTIRTLAGSLDPNLRDQELQRAFTLDGNTLTSTSVNQRPDAAGGTRIRWERVPPLETLSDSHRRLVGFWQHVVEQRVDAKDARLSETRRSPSIIVYTPTGHIGVHFPPLNRTPLKGARPRLHPAGLRCSSLTYSRYARSSRLAGRAPRRPQ